MNPFKRIWIRLIRSPVKNTSLGSQGFSFVVNSSGKLVNERSAMQMTAVYA
ncbi:hypothetical protein [Facklamia sp. HMSC062C11]|uniref:hypothetical protein n=1 Tax=Facklamia sp. HMSC062C11 TaxID=1739262 RepID=UPI000AA4BCA9|nr:hypothetical protein [Facklamia sp. HMSC062C11]